MVVSGRPYFDPLVWRPTLTLHLIYAGLALVYLAFLIARRRLPGPTGLDLPALALLGVYVAAILDSVYPRVSWEASLLPATTLVTFYAFHDFDFLNTRSLTRMLAAVGALAAVFGLYRVGANYIDWLRFAEAVEGGITGNLIPPAVPRLSGVGDHVNIIAMAFNLTLPFAATLVLDPSGRRDRALGAAACVLIGMGLLLTVSRGAWLATAVAAPVFAGLYLLRGHNLRLQAISPANSRAVLGIAVVVIGAVFVAGLLAASQWDSRPEWLFRSSLSPRYDALSTGWSIFRDRPWLGAGPYTFPFLYNIYSAKYPIENIHPHNGYVDALVDLGLAGATVLLAGGIVLVIGLARAYRAGDERQRVLVAACAAALLTIAVHALIETPNTWGTALLPLAVVLALSVRLAPRLTWRWPLALERAPRILPLLMIGALLISYILIDSPHGQYSTSLQKLREGEYSAAAQQAAEAADSDPASAAYQFHAGVTAALDYLTQKERRGEAPPQLLDEAIDRLRAGLRREPRSAAGYANLALALRLKADGQQDQEKAATRDAAVEAGRAAIERARTDSTISAVAGTVFEWAERFDEAGFAYDGALSHDASLVQSPFWGTNATRRGLRQDAVQRARLTPCEKGRVTAFYRGFNDDLNELEAGCRRLVQEKPADARARSDLAMIIFAGGRQAEARLEARRAVSQVPDSPYVRTAYGVTLLPEGDIERARHELMLGAQLGDPDAALILAYTYSTADRASDNVVVRNLRLPPSEEALPHEVAERVEKAAVSSAPMVFDDGRQHYQLGILYYRVRFFRESPVSILIPGDWLIFASPRSLLLLAEIDRLETERAGR